MSAFLIDLLLPEPDQPRQPAARAAVHHAVEVHEAHGFVWAVRVRHARPQPAGDEREMRVRVPWLDRALLGIEVPAALQPVMLVPGPLGEQRPEGFDVSRHVLCAQPGRQAPVEKAGRRVRRPVETVRKLGQRLVLGREVGAELDNVESCPRGKLERQIAGLRARRSLQSGVT